MTEFITGFRHFFKAFSVVSQYRLWHYYLYPVLLSVILFLLTLYVSSGLTGWLTDYLYDHMLLVKPPADEGWWELIKSWLLKAAQFGVAVILKLAVWFLWLKINKYLVLILLSPVFAWLSERTEELLTGNTYLFSMTQLLKDAVRGSLLALRNFMIETALILAFTVLGWFFPLIALLSVPALAIISAYFYGFSMIDYTNERRRYSITQSIAYIRAHKGLALGNGFAYMLVDSIPILGLVVAPVNGVIGATTAVIETDHIE